MPILQVTDLWKFYDQAGGASHPALRETTFAVEAGQVVAIYGSSGSGKTTLLNLLAGLDRPSRGRIEFEGRDLGALGESRRTQLRRTKVGFVFQFFNLLPTLTAFENIFLSLELAGMPDPQAARAALAAVGLDGKDQRYPHELSGGEQQRIAIARALVKRPTLILADEPTGNLDTRTGDAVLDLLANQSREFGATLLMATHSPRTSRVADRVISMVDGVLREGNGFDPEEAAGK